jgi:hypothetical protein
MRYTVGQRRGLGLSQTTETGAEPLYVLRLDARRNEVIVGPREALLRLESMVLCAGTGMPQRVVREQVARAVDAVVQLQRRVRVDWDAVQRAEPDSKRKQNKRPCDENKKHKCTLLVSYSRRQRSIRAASSLHCATMAARSLLARSIQVLHISTLHSLQMWMFW